MKRGRLENKIQSNKEGGLHIKETKPWAFWLTCIVGTILCILGVILFIFVFTTSTTSTVTSVTESKLGNDAVLTYEVQDVSYEIFVANDKWGVGDKITVHYNPIHPSDAALSNKTPAAVVYFVLCDAAGIACLVYAIRKKIMNKRLLASIEACEAEKK